MSSTLPTVLAEAELICKRLLMCLLDHSRPEFVAQSSYSALGARQFWCGSAGWKAEVARAALCSIFFEGTHCL